MFFRPVCVKPGRKPRRQVVSRGSNVGATSLLYELPLLGKGLIILPCNVYNIAVVVRTCHLLYGQTIYCRCCTEISIYCPKWRSNDYPHKATLCQHTNANGCAVYGWEMTCTTTTVALPKAEKVIVFLFFLIYYEYTFLLDG